MEPEVLLAAKARAVRDGVTVSEVLAAAAKRALIDTDRENTDAQLLAAVERVFNLIQRIDRKRVYDQQVLKEMVGLLIRTFFNHIAAVPPKQMEAALVSGKARFNRFLDILATNLRSGQSVLNDLPVPDQAQKTEPPAGPAKPSVEPPAAAPSPPEAPIVPATPPPPTETIAPVVESVPSAEPHRTSPEATKAAADQKPPELPLTAQKRNWRGLFQ
jgi:hypothetical protein